MQRVPVIDNDRFLGRKPQQDLRVHYEDKLKGKSHFIELILPEQYCPRKN